MWFGSVGAINRFDGRAIKYYTYEKRDTQSPYSSQPRSMHSDKNGRFWIGSETGLMEFEFAKQSFRKISALKSLFIKEIKSIDKKLFLATPRGLVTYDTETDDVFFLDLNKIAEHQILGSNVINDLDIRNDSIFLATRVGLIVWDMCANKMTRLDSGVLKNLPINSLALDHEGGVWVGTHENIKLIHVDIGSQSTKIYDQFLSADIHTQPLNVMDIWVDRQGTVWVATAIDGLLQYDRTSNKFLHHLHKNKIRSSPSGNRHRCLFEDKDGTIWLGGDVNGVDYFNPKIHLFENISPFPDKMVDMDEIVGRGIAVDQDKKIWMGTHEGVTCYDPNSKKYKIWRNTEKKKLTIYNNLVRTLLCDAENNIWIGTASGVNRYNNKTQNMEFVDSSQLPLSFYNSINQDNQGNIWFCTNDTATLYYYSPVSRKYKSIYDHPVLSQIHGFTPTSYVYEDSKSRLWISLGRQGVAMYNRTIGQITYYRTDADTSHSIAGNQVISIKEDKKGMIWVSSLNGISRIDLNNQSIKSYTHKDGLASNFTSSLVIDDDDRIWLGVTGGLMMIDSSRTNFTQFTLNDGLPSIGFSEHAGIKTNDGFILIPCNHGYIRFEPKTYKPQKKTLPFYLPSFRVFDKVFTVDLDNDQPSITLPADQNRLTFDIVALQFLQPEKTWFAYQLKGFEINWHYTQDPKATYTNIPGGDYIFYYKACIYDTECTHTTAKQISIHIKTVYYKTIEFIVAMIIAIASILIGVLLYRNKQQKTFFQLKGMAESLEKDKAMVMYENLKQHLNPHFLFNSLSSLSSLIRLDQKQANDFLDKMNKVYRYILKNKDNVTVPLREELKFVEVYIQLQKTRIVGGLQVDMDISEEWLEWKIAPATLQNLVENAIKHNIADNDIPLAIHIFVKEGYLWVQNNLQKKKVVETSHKQGQVSMISLYTYLTDKPVIISETSESYTVKIPLI